MRAEMEQIDEEITRLQATLCDMRSMADNETSLEPIQLVPEDSIINKTSTIPGDEDGPQVLDETFLHTEEAVQLCKSIDEIQTRVDTLIPSINDLHVKFKTLAGVRPDTLRFLSSRLLYLVGSVDRLVMDLSPAPVECT